MHLSLYERRYINSFSDADARTHVNPIIIFNNNIIIIVYCRYEEILFSDLARSYSIFNV